MAHQVQFFPPEERRDATDRRVENKILLAIPDNEFRAIRPHLEAVELDSHQILHEAHEVLEYAYFPNDGLLSLVVVLAEEKTVEAGIVGKEGLVGIPALAGLSRSPLREVVQITGEGLRIPAASLRDSLATAPQLRYQMERFAVVLGLQVAQTAGCNRLHGVEQRLARWLLMAQDRVKTASLPITHDFLATMLGTDRPSVSLAAGVLQKAKVIEYSRGSVKILNRTELERIACECYGVIQRYSGEM
ncbi:MAG TPA: Crp/Fnr family transcriptional regulator [Candidatus Acidoferrum sp.]|nr:Crp/Fnr family transcriptional regulator [Candidatus Acidoferrum sp.]